MKKKLIVWLCILALLLSVLSFVGCKDKNGNDGPEGGDPSTEQGPGTEGGGPTDPTEPTPGGPGEEQNPTPDEVQGGNDPYVPDQEW